MQPDIPGKSGKTVKPDIQEKSGKPKMPGKSGKIRGNRKTGKNCKTGKPGRTRKKSGLQSLSFDRRFFPLPFDAFCFCLLTSCLKAYLSSIFFHWFIILTFSRYFFHWAIFSDDMLRKYIVKLLTSSVKTKICGICMPYRTRVIISTVSKTRNVRAISLKRIEAIITICHKNHPHPKARLRNRSG